MNLKIYQKTKYNNIYKHIKNGTYAVDLSLGYDQYGKRIRTTKSGIKTEKEARDILSNEEKKRIIKAELSSNSLFKDGLDEYFEYCEKQQLLKKSTMKSKRGRFKNNITPFFGEMKIVKINDKEIVSWHVWLDKCNLDDESKNTIQKQLSAYFNWLIKYKKIIVLNPCSLVKNYKIPKKEIAYYTIDEINLLFKTIENDNGTSERKRLLMTAILKLFFFGGYRPGELFGLKFKNIKADIRHSLNFDDEIAVEISQTVYYSNGWELSDGKTESSIDTDWIAGNAIYHLARYVQYMEKYYCTYTDDDYIFWNPDYDKIYSLEGIRKIYNEYINKAGLKKIKLKDLRHSCGTFLLSIGYKLEDVKDKLRHTSIRTTEKHYATFYNETRRKRAKDMGKYA